MRLQVGNGRGGGVLQHVDGPEMLLRLRERLPQSGAVGDVGREAGGADARVAELVGHRVELGFSARHLPAEGSDSRQDTAGTVDALLEGRRGSAVARWGRPGRE